MAHLESMQLGLGFYVGNANVGADDDAMYKIHKKAFELIDQSLAKVKGGKIPEGTSEDVVSFDLCEFDYATDEKNERPVFMVWFHGYAEFPLELAKALKDFCLEQYREAAAGLPVEFARAKTYKILRITETSDWAEV